MATLPEVHMVHGAVTRGVWCEVHNLPHILQYKVYSWTEPAAGYLNVRMVKEVSQCDLR